MPDLTVRPDGPEGQPDNVTPTPDVHFDGPGTWESENLPCGYPFNAVRFGETTGDPAKVTCAVCIETLDDEVPVDERSCWPICEPCANGRKEDCERLAAEREPDRAEPDWSRFEACPACWASAGAPCQILGGYTPRDPHPDRQLKPVEASVPVESEQTWYFTFGGDHTHPVTGENLVKAYVEVVGTCDSSRDTMFALFGNRWSMQYDSPERAGVERYGLRRVELPPEEPTAVAPDEPVSTERRTVSLEVLTAELLRFVSPHTYTELLVATTVGIVLRVSGEPVAVPETDVDWPREHRQPADVLAQMLQQARFYASDAGDADLLMPTPDVLAALDGRPDATFWTAPVTVRAEDVQEGWIAVDYSGPDVEEPVTGKTALCTDPGCPWPGDCTALTIGDDPKPQHFADWTLLDVRIPASVTR